MCAVLCGYIVLGSFVLSPSVVKVPGTDASAHVAQCMYAYRYRPSLKEVWLKCGIQPFLDFL